MRTFIRQPTGIAVEIDIADKPSTESHPLKNISFGGLCYRAEKPIEAGTKVNVRLPLPTQRLEVQGKVSWCRRSRKEIEVGVQFLPEEAENRVLLVGQVCELEHQRKERLEKEKQASGNNRPR